MPTPCGCDGMQTMIACDCRSGQFPTLFQYQLVRNRASSPRAKPFLRRPVGVNPFFVVGTSSSPSRSGRDSLHAERLLSLPFHPHSDVTVLSLGASRVFWIQPVLPPVIATFHSDLADGVLGQANDAVTGNWASDVKSPYIWTELCDCRQVWPDCDHCAFLPAFASVLSQLHAPSAQVAIDSPGAENVVRGLHQECS